MRRLILVMISLFLLVCVEAQAQPELYLRTVDTALWPEIGVGFRVHCDGVQRDDVTRTNLRLFEDGREIDHFDVWCPELYGKISIGVALVLDGSADMVGTGTAEVKSKGHAFVDMMDGIIDEATVTLFNDHAATYQAMTPIKPMLHSAIDALGTNGGSALYDALYLSVIEVAYNSFNPGKALIVMTDSSPDSSYRTLPEVLALAKQHRIPIHMISFGGAADTAELRMIASETGGQYLFRPNAGQMAALYQTISYGRTGGDQDCLLRYTRHCADGNEHEIVVQLRYLCGDMVEFSRRYAAPLDSSTLEPLHLTLVGDTVLAEKSLHLGLHIVDPVADRQRGAFHFTVQYDTTLLAFPYVSAWESDLLRNLTITATPIPGGVRVTATGGNGWSEAEGALLHLSFRTHAPAGRGDTIPLTVAVTDAAFEDGCPDLRIDDAHAVILAHGPELWFDGEHPGWIYWNGKTGEWEPPDFLVKVRVYNTGDRDAENVTMRLAIDTTKLRFVTPNTGVYALPGGTLAAGDWAEATWQLMPQAGVRPLDSVLSCMTLYASNNRSHTCCCRMYFVDAPLAVERAASAQLSLELWPNPGRGLLRVALPTELSGTADLFVTDALGRIVLRRDVDAAATGGPSPSGEGAWRTTLGATTLDLSVMPPGLYLLRLVGSGRQWLARYLLTK
ncbi:MAG: VWA domain-containing protein [Bacteroidetes bacterium]|nr:VWA domain-containing protein [Bacteroidota bacterium]